MDQISIRCPKCGESIELTDAISKEMESSLRNKLLKEFEAQQEESQEKWEEERLALKRKIKKQAEDDNRTLIKELKEQLKLNEKACYFMYDEEPMYTKRESELLQQYMAQYGEMPKGNRELDDLF